MKKLITKLITLILASLAPFIVEAAGSTIYNHTMFPVKVTYTYNWCPLEKGAEWWLGQCIYRPHDMKPLGKDRTYEDGTAKIEQSVEIAPNSSHTNYYKLGVWIEVAVDQGSGLYKVKHLDGIDRGLNWQIPAAVLNWQAYIVNN